MDLIATTLIIWHISDRMIVIKVLVQGIIISVISVNASQCGLKDVQEDNSMIHINVVRKLWELQ